LSGMPKSVRAAPGRMEDRCRASALFYIPTLGSVGSACFTARVAPSCGHLPTAVPFPVRGRRAAAATAERRQHPRAIRQLKLAAPLSMRGYDRDLFPHWISQGGDCDTRDRVLIRDARDVNVSSDCRITSGTWRSFYDGLTFTNSSRVDIDHVVPLANAWRSGAKRWSRHRRRQFANDLDNSQLIAVSASSNRSKRDQGPDSWKPPRRAAWCLYSRWWVQVKRAWRLTVIRAERTELRKMVATC
jgi:Protein of unknown function (DUF1524)